MPSMLVPGAAPGVSPIVQPAVSAFGGIPPPAADTVGVPSECLLLKNMFDPKLEVFKTILFGVSLKCLLLFCAYICSFSLPD